MEIASVPAAVVVAGLNGGGDAKVEAGEEDKGVEKRRDEGGLKSVWRKPAPPPAGDPAAATAEGKKMEGAVMGSESWPALKDATSKGYSDADSKLAPAAKASSTAAYVGAAPENVSPHSPTPMQVHATLLSTRSCPAFLVKSNIMNGNLTRKDVVWKISFIRCLQKVERTFYDGHAVQLSSHKRSGELWRLVLLSIICTGDSEILDCFADGILIEFLRLR